MKIKAMTYLLVLYFATTCFAQLSTLETENLRLIYYSKEHEFVVPHLARCFENALRFHRELFDYRSNEPVNLLLQDFGDYGNGGATPLPNNFIFVGIAPFRYVYETEPANERMNWMMNHEIVHIVASDQAAGSDKLFRSLFFGKVATTPDQPLSMLYSYLTNPRWYVPRWYHEGIAVFLETWMAGGLGRAQGAYDEMVFRTKVRDKGYIYDMVGIESEGKTTDFQVGVNSYLYGTRFMSYLALHYSPQRLLAWIGRTEGTKKYFLSQFKQVFGSSLDDVWSDWIAWEHEWQKANLEAIRENPQVPYREITRNALGSVSKMFYNPAKGRIYAAINYPGQVAHIAGIDVDSGRIHKIHEIKGAAIFFVSSLAYDPQNEVLFFTSDNNRWRDLNALYLSTGSTETLIKDVRTGDLAYNQADSSIWGVRHYNGLSTLVRIAHPYNEWDQIYTFDYGFDIFDLDISRDGSIITSALAEPSGKQKLIRMDTKKLLEGERSYQEIFDFETSTPANFVFSDDDRYLYGSSYYSGVSNLYRYDFEKDDMSVLSNCETGFFRPVPVSDDSLIAIRYTGGGFMPVKLPIQFPERVSAVNFLGNEIAKKHPVVRSWKLGSPLSVNLDSLTTYSGRYNPIENIGLSSAYPIVEGYKDFAAFGMHFDFSEAIGISRFDITASYSPDGDLPSDERVHIGFNFHHWNWEVRSSYNGAGFYDLFGPTKTSRKGYSLGIKNKKNLLFDEPKTMDLELSVAGYANLDRLPEFQNVIAPFDKLLTFSASLDYEYVRKSLGAVDDEKGVRWQLTSDNNFVNSELFPRLYTTLDYGVALPLNHSSIWFSGSAGYSLGDRDNPFANFFFGGFGNNHVDRLTEKRYRKYYSFPGVELNAIGGKNYAKGMVEWNLPPLRFRRFGFPAFYFNWARLALFSSGIRTNWDDEQSRQTFVNLGAQLDFRMVLFSNLSSTLSFGFASAFKRGRPLRKEDTEFMVSLKIL